MTQPLEFDETGPATAPSLVLLSGGGIGRWMWREHLPDLSRDFHCLVPDLPEHGESQAAGPFSLPAAAEQVAALIEQRAHGGRAHIAGLSLGGQVGVTLLGVAPDRLGRAVLSGVLARPVPFSGLINWSLKYYGPFKDQDFMIRANQRSLGVPDRYATEFAADTRRLSPEALARIISANLAFEVPPGLGRRPHHVLFLAGEREMGLMRRSAQELAQAMPAGQAGMVRDRQHNWVLSEPALFTRTLRAWLLGGHLPDELLLLPRAEAQPGSEQV